jgi:hypothetical protein
MNPYDSPLFDYLNDIYKGVQEREARRLDAAIHRKSDDPPRVDVETTEEVITMECPLCKQPCSHVEEIGQIKQWGMCFKCESLENDAKIAWAEREGVE